ncbi:metallopeptidase [Deinococcus grandis]|uniref:Metallopeptidase n=1 Tax=Deinococcus grandis TaxID=57498 RepID=A0A100HIC3_9DEIO|nr:M12 family metallopeptidase [Deinococcus grandis]BBN95214.1 hypothetical protein DEGR_19470 [Deinococcus grandis]GAQ21293.1 metallopeptidase [Deinococcus grandis]
MRVASSLIVLSVILAACSPSPTPDARVTPEKAPATLIMPDGTEQQVMGFKQDGYLMLEDDIILASLTEKPLGKEGTYVVDTRYRWTGRTIPYTFAANVPQAIRDRVAAAASTIRSTTNVVVTPRTSTTQRNYVEITYNTGTSCASSLGMVGGKQTITLADRCTTGSIIHEFGHAMGLFHEQTRPDRDKSVTIIWANIPADWQSQYQIRSGSAGYGAYDFDSIMHYPAFFDGKIAIQPIDPSIDLNRMGQRNGFSTTDKSTINAMYPR